MLVEFLDIRGLVKTLQIKVFSLVLVIYKIVSLSTFLDQSEILTVHFNQKLTNKLIMDYFYLNQKSSQNDDHSKNH